jgi:hypothetical protein
MDKTHRVVYHVVPGQRGGWSVKQVDSSQEFGNHSSRTQAILQARDLALAQTYSLLVVHDREGKVEKQYNYGRRPG